MKLDRLARSTQHLLELIDYIRTTEASFCSLSEPWADTTSHAGKMIMTVFAGIAEFERDLIRERTGAGRAAAKQRGVRFGRPEKMNEEQKQLAKRLLQEDKSVSEIAKTFNVHKATIYRLQQERFTTASTSYAILNNKDYLLTITSGMFCTNFLMDK